MAGFTLFALAPSPGYQITGSSTTKLEHGVSAAPGVYSILTSVVTRLEHSVPSFAGQYHVQGSAAGLLHQGPGGGFSIPAGSGSYTLAGSALTFEVVVPSDSALYAITGSAVGLNFGSGPHNNYSLILGPGSYALTGAAVTLTQAVGAVTNYVLPVAAGNYALSGLAIGFGRGMRVGGGNYALSGTFADLRYGPFVPLIFTKPKHLKRARHRYTTISAQSGDT